MKKINVLIYTEDILADAELYDQPDVKLAYPNGLHDALAGAFCEDKYNVCAASVTNVSESVTAEVLADTDVLFWWGHCWHQDVPDSVAELVVSEVQKGMGFVALHSAHNAKPFTRLIGTSGSLEWRLNDRERLWTAAPYHPIAKGVPAFFDLPNEEMYGEPFDIPNPEDTVFLGWFAGGEVFRSGVTFRRGYGRVFYFQPGHEEHPIYYDETIRLILRNAANWAAPVVRRESLDCRHAVKEDN